MARKFQKTLKMKNGSRVVNFEQNNERRLTLHGTPNN